MTSYKPVSFSRRTLLFGVSKLNISCKEVVGGCNNAGSVRNFRLGYVPMCFVEAVLLHEVNLTI
jgi:hypothetical protein